MQSTIGFLTKNPKWHIHIDEMNYVRLNLEDLTKTLAKLSSGERTSERRRCIVCVTPIKYENTRSSTRVFDWLNYSLWLQTVQILIIYAAFSSVILDKSKATVTQDRQIPISLFIRNLNIQGVQCFGFIRCNF